MKKIMEMIKKFFLEWKRRSDIHWKMLMTCDAEYEHYPKLTREEHDRLKKLIDDLANETD